MEFKELIPELSVFDIQQTKDFYEKLGFKTEYERKADKFVFMSFQGSSYEIQGGIVAEPVEFLIQDPNGYLLRFTN